MPQSLAKILVHTVFSRIDATLSELLIVSQPPRVASPARQPAAGRLNPVRIQRARPAFAKRPGNNTWFCPALLTLILLLYVRSTTHY